MSTEGQFSIMNKGGQFNIRFPVTESLLNEAKQQYPTLQEIAKQDYLEPAKLFLKRVKNTSGKDLGFFSASLRHSELILIFHALKHTVSSEDQLHLTGKLTDILDFRMKGKFFNLNWAMLQHDYDNIGLLHSMRKICDYMKTNHEEEYRCSIFSKLEDNAWHTRPESQTAHSEVLPELAYKLFLEEADLLRRFMFKYGIDEKSPLGNKLCCMYFSDCPGAAFRDNSAIFLQVISDDKCEETVALAERYIMNLEISQHIEKINRLIIEKYLHQKYDRASLSTEAAGMLKQWMNIKELELYFGPDNRKYLFWRRYYRDISNVKRDPETDIMFFEIGSFVLVDTGEPDAPSYLYKKDSFKTEFEFYKLRKEQQEGSEITEASQSDPFDDTDKSPWKINHELSATAREVIIKEARPYVYKLNYENVGILYIKELLTNEKINAKIWN